MQVQAGKLRHRITIRLPVRTRDSHGQPVEGTPTVVASNVPANVFTLSGVEFVDNEQTRGIATHRIFIRARSGITIEHEILWGDRVLGIVSVRDTENRGKLLSIDCREGV